MNRMNRFSSCVFAMVSVCSWLFFAPPANAGSPGIDAFLRNGAGVREIGMGKAGTSLLTGASSFYWNPAGLGYVEGTEITSLFSKPFSEVDGLQYHTVGFAHRSKGMHVGYGLSAVYFDAGDLRGADVSGNLTGSTFGSSDGALYFSFGAQIGGSAGTHGHTPVPAKVSVGANVKAVRGEIADFTTTGFGADIGALFAPVEWFRMGLMAENVVAPTFTFRTTDEKFPLRIRGGMSIDPFHWMTLAADVENEEGDLSERLGAEVRMFSGVLAFRGGYTTDTKEVLAGIGIRAKILRLDYAYSSHDDLGQTHRVGLTIRFK